MSYQHTIDNGAGRYSRSSAHAPEPITR
jgi:hypothetical protein